MKRTLPEVAAGQRWSFRDDAYEGWRYLTVTSVGPEYVYARGNTRHRPNTRILRRRFAKGSRWGYCGHDGPGPLPPYTKDGSVILGCYPFGRHATTLPLEADLDPGFGVTTVYRDGEQIWQWMETDRKVSDIEAKAIETPGDWRLRIESPMSERLYQRQDDGWVLVAIGHGFA